MPPSDPILQFGLASPEAHLLFTPPAAPGAVYERGVAAGGSAKNPFPAAAPAPAPLPVAGWACAACTLVNRPLARTCEACQELRTDTTPLTTACATGADARGGAATAVMRWITPGPDVSPTYSLYIYIYIIHTYTHRLLIFSLHLFMCLNIFMLCRCDCRPTSSRRAKAAASSRLAHPAAWALMFLLSDKEFSSNRSKFCCLWSRLWKPTNTCCRDLMRL